MNKLIFLDVTLNSEGVIETITVDDQNNILGFPAGMSTHKLMKKQDLVSLVLMLYMNGMNLSMETADGTKVTLVDGKYFRTNGDDNVNNDLLDLA
jgi:hypothetical protein